MKYILALDQGTTSSRAIIFDKDSNIVAVEQQEFTPPPVADDGLLPQESELPPSGLFTPGEAAGAPPRSHQPIIRSPGQTPPPRGSHGSAFREHARRLIFSPSRDSPGFRRGQEVESPLGTRLSFQPRGRVPRPVGPPWLPRPTEPLELPPREARDLARARLAHQRFNKQI